MRHHDAGKCKEIYRLTAERKTSGLCFLASVRMPCITRTRPDVMGSRRRRRAGEYGRTCVLNVVGTAARQNYLKQ